MEVPLHQWSKYLCRFTYPVDIGDDFYFGKIPQVQKPEPAIVPDGAQRVAFKAISELKE